MNPKRIRLFMSKIEKTNNCWIWVAGKNKDGYGLFWNGEKPINSHRISYELFVGDIPQGNELDHLCKNRACVNPEHLEVVTHRINTLRGDAISSKNARKTHCNRGHEYTPENTRMYKNHRNCKKCDIIRYRLSQENDKK